MIQQVLTMLRFMLPLVQTFTASIFIYDGVCLSPMNTIACTCPKLYYTNKTADSFDVKSAHSYQ